MKTVLGIFCKQPIAGKVKTRLAADLGSDAAARLYEAFLKDIVERLRGAAEMVLLVYTPDDEETETFASRLAGVGVGVVPQSDGNLGERLATFFDHAKQSSGAMRAHWRGLRMRLLRQHLASDVPTLRKVVIGSDSPTITRSRIRQAFAVLDQYDAVVGRSEDGGYYLIGLNRPAEGLFDGIDWSTPVVFDQQLERLKAAGFRTKELAPIPEVDTIEDLHKLIAHPLLSECPHTCRVLDELNLR